MCMGVPMKVLSVDGWVARCMAEGVTKTVNLMLLGGDEVCRGEFVLVHRDHALRKLSAEDADNAWKILREALAMDDARHSQSESPA